MSYLTYTGLDDKSGQTAGVAKGRNQDAAFFEQARVEAGVLLRRLQRGEKIALPQSRPMHVIGRGCHELRIQDADRTWRIVYYIDAAAIVILEVFAKSTRTTPGAVIALCKSRLGIYKSI